MELTKKELLAQKITAAATEDQEFFKAFIGAQDAPALQKVLQNNGFEFTLEGIDEFFANGVDGILAHNGSAELTEDQLDDVAGGGFIKGTARLIVSCGVAFGYGALCGICPAAYAGAPYVAGGLTAWTTAGYLSNKKKK